MDIGRYCYSTEARFFRDSEVTIPIRWYRAHPDAMTFPTPHKFKMLGWEHSPHQREGLGEIYGAPALFSEGSTPPTALGQGLFGDLESFRQGSLFDPDLDVQRDRWGVAKDCSTVPDCFILLESTEPAIILLENNTPALPEICDEE